MRFLWLVTAIAPLALASAPAFAVDPLDIQHCQQMGDADLTIQGCGNIAADKSVDAHDRAVAAFNLGIGYYAKNDLDNSIKAWTEATAFEPGYAHAYNNLAKAYLARRISPRRSAITARRSSSTPSTRCPTKAAALPSS